MKFIRISSIVLFLATVVLYQNCGPSPQPSNPSDEIVRKLGDSVSTTGVHQFNIRLWSGGSATVDHRGIEDSNIVDFFSISPALSNAVAPDQNFIILIMNGRASSDVILKFNDLTILAGQYQTLVDQYLKGGSGLIPYQLMVGPNNLSLLKVVVPKVAGAFSLRIAREEFVRLGEFNSNGEYCDGALVIQIVDPKKIVIDPNSGLVTSGVFLEMAIYAVSPQDL